MFIPRIVVLDDDPVVYPAVHRLLAPRGYDVVSHGRAATAPRFVGWQQPALVILELHLEYFDAGFTVVRELRADPGTAAIPILVMSADWNLGCRVASLRREDVVALSKHHRELLPRAVDYLVGLPLM